MISRPLNSICLLVFSVSTLAHAAHVTTSSTTDSFPAGAIDGDRFSFGNQKAWKGRAGESNWWWQIDFSQPRAVGAILQIHGDHEFVFRNAPQTYQWQTSDDGAEWRVLSGGTVTNEARLYRLHRLTGAVRARFLRLTITQTTGSFPTIREIEFFATTNVTVKFPEWIIAVNTTHDPALPGHGREFIPLAQSCDGFKETRAQQINLTDFSTQFVNSEPRPLCAFLSGNFKDWCEVDRKTWRPTQTILKQLSLPIWASCGGAQGLAILAETGVDKPWDCPHCRDPKNPKLPIYTHIGHTSAKHCGDYSGCIHERGPHAVRRLQSDPVFAGLPDEFQVMQSHCGQIEWAPTGWEIITGPGEGSLTKAQCLRVQDQPIYAAQFHIEMPGTPENSRTIMANFLKLARDWNSRR